MIEAQKPIHYYRTVLFIETLLTDLKNFRWTISVNLFC